MSNLERQRRFRERNPDYFKQLRAKQRAAQEAACEAIAQEKAIAKTISPPMRLCLPAPEQVTLSWADQLIRDIQHAAVQREAAVPTAMKIERSRLLDAA